jgi:hypothetical protein
VAGKRIDSGAMVVLADHATCPETRSLLMHDLLATGDCAIRASQSPESEGKCTMIAEYYLACSAADESEVLYELIA